VVAEVAGVGERPVVAAGTVIAAAGAVAARAAIPVVVVLGGLRLGLVGEGEQLQKVVVGDPPVELGAPEIVVAVGVPGLGGIDVARVAVAHFVHGEEEQPVLHDRAGCPDVCLVERTVVTAPAIALVDSAVAVELVVARGRPGRRLERDLGAGVEFVAAGAGHGVDDAAGAASELRRVSTGL